MAAESNTVTFETIHRILAAGLGPLPRAGVADVAAVPVRSGVRHPRV
jgi:hypothetical protein